MEFSKVVQGLINKDNISENINETSNIKELDENSTWYEIEEYIKNALNNGFNNDLCSSIYKQRMRC